VARKSDQSSHTGDYANESIEKGGDLVLTVEKPTKTEGLGNGGRESNSEPEGKRDHHRGPACVSQLST